MSVAKAAVAKGGSPRPVEGAEEGSGGGRAGRGRSALPGCVPLSAVGAAAGRAASAVFPRMRRRRGRGLSGSGERWRTRVTQAAVEESEAPATLLGLRAPWTRSPASPGAPP
eukprot:3293253-Alexandrium_andersonii.AAC.1